MTLNDFEIALIVLGVLVVLYILSCLVKGLEFGINILLCPCRTLMCCFRRSGISGDVSDSLIESG